MAARGGSVHGGQVGGNVHPLPLPRRRLVESAALSFSLRVDNFPHIRQAYGEDAARAVLVQLTRRLSDALGVNGLVEPGPNGVMECLRAGFETNSLNDSVWRHAGQSGNSVAECVDWLKRLCADAPLLPVETSVGSIHFALSADELISASAMPTVTSVLGQVGGGFAGDVARPDSGWAEQYRSDMAMASGLLTGLGSKGGDAEPVLAWQPVRDADRAAEAGGSEGVLYWEGCLRHIDRDGQASSLEGALGALERLGFIRLLDHRVVAMALDELDRQPGEVTIGVNISARSAALDDLWEETAQRLRQAPWVARRLVVEITETSAIPNMSEAVRFVDRLRSLGCRIAIDDFGTGYASIRNVMALSPDFVKIDRFFLHYASYGEAQQGIFEHLVGLAWSLGATVIAEGVETAEQAALAAKAGCRWQQGFFWGRPSLSRPRSFGAGLSGDAAHDSLASSSMAVGQ